MELVQFHIYQVKRWQNFDHNKKDLDARWAVFLYTDATGHKFAAITRGEHADMPHRVRIDQSHKDFAATKLPSTSYVDCADVQRATEKDLTNQRLGYFCDEHRKAIGAARLAAMRAEVAALEGGAPSFWSVRGLVSALSTLGQRARRLWSRA